MAEEATKVEEAATPVEETKVVEPVTAKTFSQDDVNNLIAKESKKATEKLLKELGIEDTTNAKAALKAYKDAEEAKKTESEKLQEAIKAEQTKATTAEQRATLAEAKLEAIQSGVPKEKAEQVVKLAMTYDGETVKDKISAMLKDYPWIINPEKPVLDKFGAPVKNNPANVKEEIAAAFSKGLRN